MSWFLDRFGFVLRVRASSDREAAEKLIAAAKKNALDSEAAQGA